MLVPVLWSLCIYNPNTLLASNCSSSVISLTKMDPWKWQWCCQSSRRAIGTCISLWCIFLGLYPPEHHGRVYNENFALFILLSISNLDPFCCQGFRILNFNFDSFITSHPLHTVVSSISGHTGCAGIANGRRRYYLKWATWNRFLSVSPRHFLITTLSTDLNIVKMCERS